MKKLRALIVGECPQLLMAMPSLLHRSGFDIDVISVNPLLKKSRFVTNFEAASNHQDMLDRLAAKDASTYDFIIPCDDFMLKNILDSNLTSAEKLKLLPVQNEKNFEHLFSKIGLSKVLAQENVTTPEFTSACGYEDIEKAAQKLAIL